MQVVEVVEQPHQVKQVNLLKKVVMEVQEHLIILRDQQQHTEVVAVVLVYLVDQVVDLVELAVVELELIVDLLSHLKMQQLTLAVVVAVVVIMLQEVVVQVS
tara:strand:- start:27 stop:332 length:306 start_codon:yes stop_codon:yes gene_type:complete